MDTNEILEEIKHILKKEKIEVFGIIPFPEENSESEKMLEFCLNHLPDSLFYLKKPAWKNPKIYIPWVRSIISIAFPYNSTREISQNFIKRGRTWISRYGFGEDYHKVLRNKLKSLKNFLTKNGFRAKICVDTFPILERNIALKAGLGFIGKNGLLINPVFGSYLFLAEVVTDLEPKGYESKKNFTQTDLCKGCQKCISACPTKALTGDGSVDPSKCIPSYNVEWKGKLPYTAPQFSGNVFGCDICQEVCPFNKKTPLTEENSFYPKEGLFAPPLDEFLVKDEKEIAKIIKGTPLERRGASGIIENLKKVSLELQTKREETELSS